KGDTCCVHNFGAIQCLAELLPCLVDGGFVLVNDYGQQQGHQSALDVEHQRFAGAPAIGVNFGLLQAYWTEEARCQWVEPVIENEHIYSRLFGTKISEVAIERFQERFSKTFYEASYGPIGA